METLKRHLLSSAVSLIVAASLAHLAQAADPVALNITGNVIASPCEVSAASKNMNIDLGNGTDLQTSSLHVAGSSSPWVKFSIGLEHCPAGTSSVTATFHGTSDPDDPETLYSNTGTATNVAVQLEGEAREPYGDGKTSTIDIASAPGGTPTWKLQTRAFTKNGNVTPGTINSVITVSFVYN
ncbi:fimbrial protein [Lelliottia amnigena]|uniref:fimbrial protein n=1 Tax=Lelliottia amnigena TaxID=61646 RepID=UPI003BA043CB